MSYENLERSFADATGFVVDRTVSPAKFLGLAFLVSKSRAVTCASSIFNYSEAPWALSVNFIYPDIALGVKSIALHNDFDKKAARHWYLNQTGTPGEQLILPNDIATLVLDAELQELQPEKLGELRGALTLPFSAANVEASGGIQGMEFIKVINGIMQSNREGLLTLYDARNIPVARILMGPGAIQKVYYKNLIGEMALFELLYRSPAEGYAFSSQATFNWGNVANITVASDRLIMEASRRANDVPQVLQQLGGHEARYQKVVEKFDPSLASENIQWLVERLFSSIDGYITLDKLPERIAIDSYTTYQAIRELVNRGVVSLLNRASPFHANGTLGTPLISHTDFEIHAWDPLQAFYLEPLSGSPSWQQGNFFGVANALQPKNMLHTIPLPPGLAGALILKDYKLVGIHSGAHSSKHGQAAPPVQCYQFMWMGALLDMSTKKLRSSEAEIEGGALSSLRTKMEQDVASSPEEKLEKYICPNCYATNTTTGPCFNCRFEIEPPPKEPEPEGKLAKAKVVSIKKLRQVQERYPINKKQLAIAIAIILGFGMIAASMINRPQPAPQTTTANTNEGQTGNSEKAMKIAVEFAGFKGTAPPGYWYEDTSEITKPAQSFGLCSKTSNQRLLFVVCDDMAPVQNLVNFVALPPFVKDVLKAENPAEARVEEDFQILGSGHFHWFLGKYKTIDDRSERILTGAYPSPVKGKSILVVGRPYSNAAHYDHKTSLWVTDQMAVDYTQQGNLAKTAGTDTKNYIGGPTQANSTAKDDETANKEKSIATEEEIDQFLKAIQESIQAKLVLPEEVHSELQKKKSKKLKVTINLAIDDEGTVKKIDIAQPSELEKVTEQVVKAITNATPFEGAPRTKEGLLTVKVKLNKDKIKVEKN